MMEAGVKVSHLCCRYEDGGKVRPILHRASLVEMAVVSYTALIARTRVIRPFLLWCERNNRSVKLCVSACL